MTLTIDAREQKLLQVIDVPHQVQTLAVGDFFCRYGDATKNWIGERKTARILIR